MDDFLNDLFGFMTSALKVTEGWRFTTAEFDRKFTELTARYMKGSVRFPRVNAHENARTLLDQAKPLPMGHSSIWAN